MQRMQRTTKSGVDAAALLRFVEQLIGDFEEADRSAHWQ